MENLSNYLFLLIANLAQQRDVQRIKNLFIEGLISFLPNSSFKWEEKGGNENSIVVCTRKNHFGNIIYSGNLNILDENYILIQNAAQMLAVILERLLQEDLITDKKLELESLIEKRTAELIKQNNEYESLNEAYLAQNEELTITNQLLSLSEERFKMAMNAAHDGIYDWNIETGETYFSPGWKKMLGYKTDELSNNFSTWEKLTMAEDVKKTWKILNDLFEKREKRLEVEFKMKHKNGHWVEILSRGEVKFNSEGKAIRLIGTHVDITERKHIESEREITLKLVSFLNKSNDLHELISEVTELMQGWSGCEAVGIRLKDGYDYPYFETRGFPKEFVKAENSLCSQNSAGEVVKDSKGNPVLECMCGNIIYGRFDPKLPFFTKNGSFWTNSTTKLLSSTSEEDRQARTRNRCNGEGYESVALIPLKYGTETLGLLQLNDRQTDRFTISDIELFERLAQSLALGLVQRRDARNLQTSEKQFKSYTENSPIAIYTTDKNSNCIYANEKWLSYAGMTLEETKGDGWKNAIHPDDRESIMANWYRSIKSGGAWQYEYRVLDKKGKLTWVEGSAKSLFDDNNEIIGYIGSNVDITERKLSRENIIKAKELVEIQKNKLEALFAGAKSVLELDDFQKTACDLFNQCKLLTGSASGYIALLSPEKNENEVLFLNPGELEYTVDKNLSMPIYGLQQETNQLSKVFFQNNFTNSECINYLPEGNNKLKNVMLAPLIINKKTVGLIGLANKPYDFTKDDVSIVTTFAELASIALNNARTKKELIEAKNHIEEREERLRFLFENMIQGVVYHNSSGKIIYANFAAAKILGLTLDQLFGKDSMDSHWRTIHEDGSNFPGNKHPVMVTLKTGKAVKNVKMGVYNPIKKKYQWININSIPKFKEGQKKPYQVVVTFEDITEIINAGNELATAKQKAEESEKQFRQLFENMEQGFALHQMICDENGNPFDYRFMLMNRSFEKLTGMNANDFIGKTVREVLPNIEQAWINNYGQVALAGKPMQFENYSRDLGKYYDVIAYSPKKDFFATVFTDITENKMHEKELEKHRNHLELLVKERTDELEASNEELKATNEELHKQKNKLETALKKLNETHAQLVQSEKMASLGVLVAGVAHEINNPINFINSSISGLKNNLQYLTGYTNLYSQINENTASIIERINEKEKETGINEVMDMLKRSIEIIEVGIERTTKIVKGLKSFARSDEKELELYNLNENIDNTLLILYNQYKNRIEIIREYAHLPLIECYAGQINQVIMNLLTNAVQAIKESGKIKIKTGLWKKKDFIYFEINDTGSGIDKDVIDRIFEPFYTTKKVGQGTGLGLSISYGIVKSHKGKIKVKSEKDRGSSFKIILPIRQSW